MWIVYLDESKQENSFFVYTAVITGSDVWRPCFSAVKAFRNSLRDEHGIYKAKELHAWKFAAGKGRISDRVLSKIERAEIFGKVLKFIADNKNYFRVISSVNTDEYLAFDRLINRINRTAKRKNTTAMIISDQGQEAVFTRRIRKMRVYNPIASRFGTWEDGSPTKNITIDNIIEDPFFKDSRQSYFVQLADFCAYALLRMERPIQSRTELGYDQMYKMLSPCVVRACNTNDPRQLGIIR